MSMSALTLREQEVLRLVVSGLSTKQIAGDLGISFKTAACHRANIMTKLAARNAVDLVVRAAQQGWIQLDGAGKPTAKTRGHYSAEKIRQIREQMCSEFEMLRARVLEGTDLRQCVAQSRRELQKASLEIKGTVASLLQNVRGERGTSATPA